jgi:hypothetical protein
MRSQSSATSNCTGPRINHRPPPAGGGGGGELILRFPWPLDEDKLAAIAYRSTFDSRPCC